MGGWAGLHNVGMTCAAEVTQPHRPGVAQASLVLAFFWRRSACKPARFRGLVRQPVAPNTSLRSVLPGAHGEGCGPCSGPAGATPRYRVVVVPGSGCAGMGPFADRYFRGLLHAQVTVLHKPGVHPADTTPAADCPARFVQADHLSAWPTTRAALKAGHHDARSQPCRRAMAAGGYFGRGGTAAPWQPARVRAGGPGDDGGQWAGPA